MQGDPHTPLPHASATSCIRRAERLADIPHLSGSTCHSLRRGWATARKHLPLHNVAAEGGSPDTVTLMASYLDADAEAPKAPTTFVA